MIQDKFLLMEKREINFIFLGNNKIHRIPKNAMNWQSQQKYSHRKYGSKYNTQSMPGLHTRADFLV